MTRSEKDKLRAGDLYRANDPQLDADHARACAWMARYNSAIAEPVDARHALLAELFAHVGAGAVVRPPFHCDYGSNISLGAGAFLNFNCVILDSVWVEIGARHADRPRRANSGRRPPPRPRPTPRGARNGRTLCASARTAGSAPAR